MTQICVTGPQCVNKGKLRRGMGVKGRQGRRCRKLLDDLKERRGYSHFNPSLHFVPYMTQYTYFHIFLKGMVLPLYCCGVTDMIQCNGRHWEVVNKHAVCTICDTYPYNVTVDNNHDVSYVIHIQTFIKIRKNRQLNYFSVIFVVVFLGVFYQVKLFLSCFWKFMQWRVNTLWTNIFFLYIYHKSLIQSKVPFFFFFLNPARRNIFCTLRVLRN
jgi:hypothetical protein